MSLGGPGGRMGVVIEARPMSAPTRVRVLWEPLEELYVTEHDWPPTSATIVGFASLKIGRRPRAARGAAGAVEEPLGFAAWLDAHVEEGARYGVQLKVPGAATTRRAKLAKTFEALVGEGYDDQRLRAASVGVLADDYMREHGHVHPENVLRVEKVGRRADDGERVLAARAAAVASGDTDWGQFDA